MNDELAGGYELPDVHDLSLADVVDISNPHLARVAARIIDSLDDPDGIISAFQSVASAPR